MRNEICAMMNSLPTKQRILYNAIINGTDDDAKLNLIEETDNHECLLFLISDDNTSVRDKAIKKLFNNKCDFDMSGFIDNLMSSIIENRDYELLCIVLSCKGVNKEDKHLLISAAREHGIISVEDQNLLFKLFDMAIFIE